MRSSYFGPAETQLISMRTQFQSFTLLCWLRIQCCRELCCCRSAAAAPIQPLAWEPPYAAGTALKSKNKNKKFVNQKEIFLWVFVWFGCIHCMQIFPRPGIKLGPQQGSKPLQCQYWILNLMNHQETPKGFCLVVVGWVFLSFCLFVFLGPQVWNMEVPRPVSNWSCICQPTSQPQLHRIWATAATYTTAQSNARYLTHQVRPGIEPTSSWLLVRSHNRNSFCYCCLSF